MSIQIQNVQAAVATAAARYPAGGEAAIWVEHQRLLRKTDFPFCEFRRLVLENLNRRYSRAR